MAKGSLSEIEAGLPIWAAAIANRLDFFRRRHSSKRSIGELTVVLAALRRRVAAPDGGHQALLAFLHACLALLEEAAASRADLASIARDLATLSDMARTSLDGDCDDRPLIAHEDNMKGLSGASRWAAQVPGRVVWLAAMAAEAPDAEAEAAIMLVNDLASVDSDFPLRALRTAVRA
ncbi:hypothetical protein GCM10010869_70260 [Mesorhizobium tianshanense]|uniref:Uncharacterized protein n=1 Tax=Mesorhizobium tianshanense TaxID=39844 RepID=A0A562NN65_9HYPH|nr:hypothetical protein [Mesorhizobium tianshanense]TWI33632.1 hypothetical protein IQ26_03901 [Mesorhizobium tianshanense]GLS41429.1 hypothetical protein GCM10010869_70260 [Mesorhizobium tianshanense]